MTGAIAIRPDFILPIVSMALNADHVKTGRGGLYTWDHVKRGPDTMEVTLGYSETAYEILTRGMKEVRYARTSDGLVYHDIYVPRYFLCWWVFDKSTVKAMRIYELMVNDVIAERHDRAFYLDGAENHYFEEPSELTVKGFPTLVDTKTSNWFRLQAMFVNASKGILPKGVSFR